MPWVDPPDYTTGQILTAAEMDDISTDLTYLYDVRPQLYYIKQTGDVTLTGSPLDLCSLTFAITNTACRVHVSGAFEFNANATTGNGLMIGQGVLDGVAQGGQALAYNESANTRITVPMVWMMSDLSAGSHTFKLQGYKLGGSGSAIAGQFTSMTMIVQDG